jgi:hypothetical protein
MVKRVPTGRRDLEIDRSGLKDQYAKLPQGCKIGFRNRVGKPSPSSIKTQGHQSAPMKWSLWKPRLNSHQAIKETAIQMIQENQGS